MNLHITGDRSASPVYPALVAVEMMRALVMGATITTGDTEKGVDMFVTQYARLAGVTVTAVSDDAVASDSLVAYIHSDPHSSSRLAPFLKRDDESVRIATPADLLV